MFNYNPPIRIINKHVLTNYSYLCPKQTQSEQLNNPIASGIHPANPLHPACIRYNPVKSSHSPRSRRSNGRTPPSKQIKLMSETQELNYSEDGTKTTPRTKGSDPG